MSALLWLTIAGLAGASPPPGDAPSAPPPRPNVLLIAVDDLNDYVGCLGGHPDARTPNIDRLAARGVLFTRAYCPAPACNPSRASILTGLAPTTTGVYTNAQPLRLARPDARTLPDDFRDAGYVAFAVGKIFHALDQRAFAWRKVYRLPPTPRPGRRLVDDLDEHPRFDWGPVDAGEPETHDGRAVRRAARLVAGPEEPLLVACGLVATHLPWYAPRRFFDGLDASSVTAPGAPDDDVDDLPPAALALAAGDGDHDEIVARGRWEDGVAAYLATARLVDESVGRLIDALDRSGRADRTIVVLFSDHGHHLGEKRHWSKFALWEQSTRVPLIIVAPGLTTAGGRCDRPVSLVDLYPTLAELCGLAPRDDLDGESLVPLLRDPGAARARPAVMTAGRGNHAVRSERYRYIRYADGAEELYDHRFDPEELRNLAADPALAEAKRELARALPASEAAAAPTVPARRPRP
jgi:arylsulfatase A-like enzyme